jgi:hypothetical protein
MAVNALYSSTEAYGRATWARNPPAHVNAAVLAAGTNESVTVPAGAAYVVFSAIGDFYARPGGTAAVPAADVTDGSASELNPAIWHVTAGATIGLIAPEANIVTLSFYG